VVLIVVYFEPQGLDGTGQVVNPIFPRAGGLKHLQFLGEGKGFANQTAIHMARSQIGALDLADMLTQQFAYFLPIAVDDFDGDAGQTASGAMFDHLQVVPIWLGSLTCGWSTPTWIRGDPAPGLDHRFPVAALTVRGDRGWDMRMTTGLKVGHELPSHFTFVLSDCPARSQAGVHI